jgi:hypothetical protein
VKLHTPLAVACLLVSISLALAQNQAPAQQATGQQTRNQQPAPEAVLDRARDADLSRLLELIGTQTVTALMTQQVMAIKKQFAPRTLALTNWHKESFQSSLEAKIHSRIIPAALAARWAPIYVRHFTPEEIKAIVVFYETPAGKKLLAESPALLQESYAAAQELRRETVADILKEMDVEFPGAKETEQALQVTPQKP